MGPVRRPLEYGDETRVTRRPLDGLATDALAAQGRMGSRSSQAGEVVDEYKVETAALPVCRGFLGQGCSLHQIGVDEDTGVPVITELARQCAVAVTSRPWVGA